MRTPSRPEAAVRPITNVGVPETPTLAASVRSFCRSAWNFVAAVVSHALNVATFSCRSCAKALKMSLVSCALFSRIA
jgi:hypothetical protein